MPSSGQTVTLTYYAFDTSANAYKTGDAANHTLYWTKDGTPTLATNAGAEVDATHKPGEYKCVMTAAEATCQVGTLGGKSSTANIILISAQIAFENLPTAAFPATGGLITQGSGAGQLTTATGSVNLASTGLDNISTAIPATTATTFATRLTQLWAMMVYKSVKNVSGHQIIRYAVDDTTPVLTQAWTDDGAGTQTIGRAT